MMGAVARIYHPGIKYDSMIILYGGQGDGKSTTVSKLGGHWYNQSLKHLKVMSPIKNTRFLVV